MWTLYDRLDALCKERGIKGGRMCADLGISKSLMTDLKSGRKKTISAITAQKIATYFGVSVGYLLGEENEKTPTENGERNVADAKAAFFDGYGENLTEKERDELWEDARVYAKFKAQQMK